MTVAALTDPQEKKKLHAQNDAQRAAAWAWYQRSSGSINQAAGAGKSEAFATRCCKRRPLSRFYGEALRTVPNMQAASSDSSLLNCSSSFTAHDHSSRSQFAGYGRTDYVDDELYGQDPQEAYSLPVGDEAVGDSEPSLELVAVHPPSGACWDCGSSLFDTFELVALSKKLDDELHESHIEADSDVLRTDQQPLPLLYEKPYNGANSPPPSPQPDHSLLISSHGTCDKLIPVPDKHTKQAVYDMFCQYGEAAKQVSKGSSNHPIYTDLTCGENHLRRHKHKHGRLHGIAKAFHQMMHLNTNSLGSMDRSSAIVLQDHHHHHHLHYSPLRQGKGNMPLHTDARWAGERLSYDTPGTGSHEVSHPKQNHFHHHHHHHYHYLFHSDDDFRLQPLDKSLMVATAGLRSPKLVSHTLSSYLESPARTDQSGLEYKWGSPHFQQDQ